HFGADRSRRGDRLGNRVPCTSFLDQMTCVVMTISSCCGNEATSTADDGGSVPEGSIPRPAIQGWPGHPHDETADDRDASTISAKSLHASSAEKDRSVSHRVPIDQRLCGPRTRPLDSRDSDGKT